MSPDRHVLRESLMNGAISLSPPYASIVLCKSRAAPTQYASRLNVAWQGRLSRLEIAVSGLYSLLLNRWVDVAFLKLESEFTTGTILWRLWKKRSEGLSGERDVRITRDTEVTFEHILAMAGALSSLDEPDPLAREEEQEEEHLLERLHEGFKAAAFKLAQLRAQLRNGVD
jgi:hypothetical protein